jgi:hypothetical protein
MAFCSLFVIVVLSSLSVDETRRIVIIFFYQVSFYNLFLSEKIQRLLSTFAALRLLFRSMNRSVTADVHVLFTVCANIHHNDEKRLREVISNEGMTRC